jgi:hypothetical protein
MQTLIQTTLCFAFTSLFLITIAHANEISTKGTIVRGRQTENPRQPQYKANQDKPYNSEYNSNSPYSSPISGGFNRQYGAAVGYPPNYGGGMGFSGMNFYGNGVAGSSEDLLDLYYSNARTEFDSANINASSVSMNLRQLLWLDNNRKPGEPSKVARLIQDYSLDTKEYKDPYNDKTQSLSMMFCYSMPISPEAFGGYGYPTNQGGYNNSSTGQTDYIPPEPKELASRYRGQLQNYMNTLVESKVDLEAKCFPGDKTLGESLKSQLDSSLSFGDNDGVKAALSDFNKMFTQLKNTPSSNWTLENFKLGGNIAGELDPKPEKLTTRTPMESEQVHYYSLKDQLNVIATYTTGKDCTKVERNNIFQKYFSRFLRQRSESNKLTDHLFNSIEGNCRYDLRIKPGPDLRLPAGKKPAPAIAPKQIK